MANGPRYRLETGGGDGTAQRALDAVSGDVDAVESRVDALEADQPYTAANATDWSGTAPTTVAAALDRLAAALGPIP